MFTHNTHAIHMDLQVNIKADNTKSVQLTVDLLRCTTVRRLQVLRTRAWRPLNRCTRRIIRETARGESVLDVSKLTLQTLQRKVSRKADQFFSTEL